MNGLEEESGIHLVNETSDEMKDVKTISRVTILSTCTENLFNHKKLNTIPSSLFHTKDSLGILSKTKVTTF